MPPRRSTGCRATTPMPAACWIGGFSFGAWIGMQLLMRRPEIDAFVAVAPPANLFDFSFLAPCPASGLIIQGDRDQLVPLEAVQRLFNKLMHQRDIAVEYRLIAGADHFFSAISTPSLRRSRNISPATAASARQSRRDNGRLGYSSDIR